MYSFAQISECDEDCSMCSGAWCEIHRDGPCTCDLIERHEYRQQTYEELMYASRTDTMGRRYRMERDYLMGKYTP